MAYKLTRIDPWLKHNERTRPVTTVVLHHTAGGTAESTIKYLRNPFIRASYHYIIERSGQVFKCVPANKRAWHAGLALGPNGSDVNSYSIGIAFANRGDGEAYTPEQIESAQVLIDTLWTQFPRLNWITAHRLITKRKIDPKGFPFESFAKKRTRLRLWRDESLKRDWDG